MAIKCYKIEIKIPNGHDIHQYFRFQNLQKCLHFGMKINRLATLNIRCPMSKLNTVCFKNL
jgi:hypothetical protein